MLITSYQHLTKDKKIEEFEDSDELSQLRTTIEKKNRKKEELIFKTNVCEKRAPRSTFFRRPFCFSLTFPAQLAVSSGRTGSVLHGSLQTIGTLPLTTTNVLPSKRRRFSDKVLTNLFFLTNEFLHQNRWQTNDTKMQMSLRKQTKTQKVTNEGKKQLFHSLFFRCMYIQRKQFPSGSHVALREPVAIKSLVF